jgi:PAS domain S-box-containing protein
MNSKKRPVIETGSKTPKKNNAKGIGHPTGLSARIKESKTIKEKLIASEARYRRLFEAARDGILILDAETGLVVDVNPFLVELLGLPREEIVGKQLWELGFFKDIAAKKTNFLELQEKEYLRYENFPLETAQGHLHNVEFISNVYEVDHHKLIQCNIRDITERKREQEALSASESRYRDLVQNANSAILRYGSDGAILFFNEYAQTFFGYTAAELLGRNVNMLVPATESSSGDLASLVQDILEHPERFVNQVNENICRDGRRVWMAWTNKAILDENGKVSEILAIGMDITERKKSEAALISSETRYRHTLDDMLEGCQIIGSDWRYLYLNDVADRHNRRPKEELLGKRYLDIWPGVESTDVFIAMRKCMEEGKPRTMETEFEFPDGHKGWFDLRIYAVPEGIVILSIDITKHKRAERVLRESEKRFHSLFENMLNGFAYCRMLFDQVRPEDFIYLEVNRAFETLTGLKGVAGKKISEVIPGIRASDPELFARYGRVALTGIPETFEIYVEALQMWFSISVYSPQKEYFVAVFDMITGRKRAEQELQAYSEHLMEMVAERTRELRDTQEKLVRQERLATLGQLAGSVGHELRNPLGVISNAVYFLKMTQSDANDTVLEYLDIIEKETRISDKIITDLLDFTRIKSVNREPANVPDLLHQMLQRYPVPSSIEVAFELPADLPPVYVDPRQIIQVLGNLTQNACQAMTSRSSGSIGLPDVGRLTLSAGAHGDMIAIAVQDTGVGIPPENMGKLFEPLYTTKTKGIGLGLAVSQKLAEANGGRIEAYSQPGKGSTFTVYLPVNDLVPDSVRDKKEN